MAATRSVIQHRGRFAIPFRQRVGDPANVVKVAVNVQRTLGSKDIADDGDFVGTRCRSSQHCANGEADNFTCPHFDGLLYLRKSGKQEQNLRLPVFLSDSVICDCSSLTFKLPLIIRAVEMAFRFADEPVIVDLPNFVATDSDAFSSTAGPAVGSS